MLLSSGNRRKTLIFTNRFALIVGLVSIIYLGITLVFVAQDILDMRSYMFVEGAGGQIRQLLRSIFWDVFNPVFLLCSAVMIEFLSRIAQYLEAIGQILVADEADE